MKEISVRILHVINSLQLGGAETVLYRLCKVSRTQGHIHAVISLGEDEPYGPLLEENGIPVLEWNLHRPFQALKEIPKVFRFIYKFRPTVFQGWMYHGSLCATLFHVLYPQQASLVWSFHNAYLSSLSTTSLLVVRLLKFLTRILRPAVVYCSEYGLQQHGDFGFSSLGACVIENGIDTEYFKESMPSKSSLEHLGPRPDTLFIGTVSRWHYQKDIPNLLMALVRLKSLLIAPWKCVLIGSEFNDQNLELVAQIDKLDLTNDVVLWGSTIEGLPEVLSALKLFVLSSRQEAFPNVLLEAMACGVPCVTTDVGDAAKMVGTAGWVVEPENAEILAQTISTALESSLSNTTRWEEQRQLARQRVVENYDLVSMCDAFERLWERGVYEGSVS